jgi:peptidoglycan lytic transglycosylase D
METGKLLPIWIVNLLILILTLGSVCCKTAPTRTAVASTPIEAPPTSTPPAQSPTQPAPSSPSAVSGISQKPSFDPADEVIKESQARFLEGEKDLKAGFLERARRNFDLSLEIVLRAGIAINQQERVERHLEGLIDRIHSYEMAALKEGDGFTEEKYESAPIDEIASGDVPLTFDPRSRMLAEETLKQVPHDIPLVINDTVLRFLDYFQNHGRKAMEVGMQRSGRYRAMISRILAEEGVPQDLIYLCQVESSFKPLALSNKKCKGMWQFDAWRGQYYGLRQNWWIDERSDPEKSTRAAARHLKDLYEQFGDWFLAMAAYNTGPGNVERAIERTGFADYWELVRRGTLHPDTVAYIPMILAVAIISKDPLKYGFEVTPDPEITVEKVQIDSAVDLRLAAETLDIGLAELKDLNPHVRRLTTPRNDPEFALYLPAGSKGKFLQEIAAVPEEMRVSWRLHRVEGGETLSVIARKYHTTPAAIAQANSLKGGRIQVGGKLIIPVTSGKGSPPVGADDSPLRYTMKRGDTIVSVAKDFDVTAAQIRRWNRLSVSSKLAPGKVLVIYPPDSRAKVDRTSVDMKTARNNAPSKENSDRVIHRVKKGETLFAIAANYKIPIDSIRDWNNLSQDGNLKVGDKLTIYLNR